MVSLCHFVVQAQFSQMRPAAMGPTVAPRMPLYPPGAPGIGQQLFYGQGPPTIIPQQVRNSFALVDISLHCSGVHLKSSHRIII